VSSKNLELDVTFEARTPADVDTIIAKLIEAHYQPHVLETAAKTAV